MIRRACSLLAAFVAVAAISGCGDDATTRETVLSAAPAATSNSASATDAALATTVESTAAAPTSTTTALVASPLTVVPVAEETTVAPPPSIDPALEDLVRQAVSDLATRLNVDSSRIDTMSAEAMSWPDGSMGCPQPGMVYTQVMVDGALIQLSAGGTLYSYHSGDSGVPFLCQKT